MQQHPIPQNVTTYQFRLIGNMTIKQFAVLGGGALLGFLIYKIPILPAIITWPLAGLAAAGGAAMAFLPYEERTLDIWLINFIRAIYSPTQFLWRKSDALPGYLAYAANPNQPILVPEIPRSDRTQLEAYLRSLRQQAQNPLDEYEQQTVGNINILFSNLPDPVIISVPDESPQPQRFDRPAGNRPHVMQPQPYQVPPTIPSPPPSYPLPTQIPPQPPAPPAWQSSPQSVINQQISELSQSLPFTQTSGPIQKPQPAPPPSFTPPPPPFPPAQPPEVMPAEPLAPPLDIGSLYSTEQYEEQNKKPKIPPPHVSTITLPPAPDIPNVITGMALSGDDRLLPNVIIQVNDQNGIPVRAVKSNKLGQFFIATPLKDGQYQITADLEPYHFATMNLTVNANIIPPITVKATEPYQEESDELIHSE